MKIQENQNGRGETTTEKRETRNGIDEKAYVITNVTTAEIVRILDMKEIGIKLETEMAIEIEIRDEIASTTENEKEIGRKQEMIAKEGEVTATTTVIEDEMKDTTIEIEEEADQVKETERKEIEEEEVKVKAHLMKFMPTLRSVILFTALL